MKKLIFFSLFFVFFSSLLYAQLDENIEEFIYQRINNFRIMPYNFFEMYSSGINKIASNIDLKLKRLSVSLPLDNNRYLNQLAKIRSDYLCPELFSIKNYNSIINVDNKTWCFVKEIIGVMIFDNPINKYKAADIILDKMFMLALEGNSYYSPLLFPVYDSVGINMLCKKIKYKNFYYYCYIVTIEFGIKKDSWFSGIIGIVEPYNDFGYVVKDFYLSCDDNDKKKILLYSDGTFYIDYDNWQKKCNIFIEFEDENKSYKRKIKIIYENRVEFIDVILLM